MLHLQYVNYLLDNYYMELKPNRMFLQAILQYGDAILMCQLLGEICNKL